MQLSPFDACDDLRIDANVKRTGDRFEFTYALSGSTNEVVIPPPGPRERADGLWQATCFEAFVSVGKTSYAELNFSPSGEWAAYSFSNYRQNMRELAMPAPQIRFEDDRLVASVELHAEMGSAFNLAAVIEHESGARSYWALAHPGSNRPDFHARDCFVATLP